MDNATLWLLCAASVFAAFCVGWGAFWLCRYMKRRKSGRALHYPVDRSEGRRWR